ncbi:MAG: Phage integrase family protein [Acidobacteria bacterium]|nr:Phage integrase family protein [Acidobacteriota bacterium]
MDRSIAAKDLIIRVHLTPSLGNRKPDAITTEDVQRLKSGLAGKTVKTVNNVLTVLSVLLKKAVEWKVIDYMPCTITLLRVSKGSTRFYDFDEFERLVSAARTTDGRAYVLVLLRCEAGLRLGEMVALEWSDIDFVKRQMCVQRSAWKGQIASPKGGRLRYIPLTTRLAAALRDHRHLRGPLVLYQDDGSPLTEGTVQGLVRRAAQKAGLFNNGPHMLRHTFCSHLAMRGADARDSRARRPFQPDDHAAVHASQSRGARQCDSADRSAGIRTISWRYIGNGGSRKCEVE